MAAATLYVTVTGMGPVTVSAFWSVVNERFDPYTAKRAVSRMAAAAALGGVLGGLAAAQIASWVGIPALLMVLGTLGVLCAWGTLRIGVPEGRTPGSRAEEATGDSGLGLLLRRPLLRQMATIMFAVAVVETLVDYALKVEAAASFRQGDALVRFFAAFYVGCGLLSFLIQSAAGNRFLRRFGLASAVAMLPASVALTGALAATAGKLWAFILARGAENVASLSLFRSGFQLLYTPVPPAVKRPAKVWVDVAAGSLGDMLGAALVLGLLALLPVLPNTWVAALAVAWCLAALAIVRRIHRVYVRQLADSLRSGSIALRAEEALDATTARTIAQSQVLVDRESLLAQARAFRARNKAEPASPPREVPPARDRSRATAPEDPVPGWVAEICSGDPLRARRVLGRDAALGPGATPARRRRLVAHVIPLLGVDSVAWEAERFLGELAPRVVGQLLDALLDPDAEQRIRTRLAGIVAGVVDPRAMEGLWRALESSDFDVRLACARGAARLASKAGSSR
jgi:hypothetical protein